MSRVRMVVMVVLSVALASCAWLTPEQQQTALQVVDSMAAQGSITRAQHDALVEALLSGSSTAWWQQLDRKSTRLNSSHVSESRMPSSA